MKTRIYTTLLLLFLIGLSNFLNAQTQKGSDIDGKAAGDASGWSVSMPDANTIAIGAPYNGQNGANSGHVRIYQWNGSIWMQKGIDILGAAAGDMLGASVSMPDTNTIAIGAPSNDNNGVNSGHVRVYEWDGNTWIQKGSDIGGEAANDFSGMSVSMPDANTIAIGAPYNAANGTNSGHARIYQWNGSAWEQKGSDIDGEAANDQSGTSVSMPDINTIAIGAPYNNDNGAFSGHVRVYEWNSSSWMQKGSDIEGETAGDASGYSVSMPDANTIAIGAPYNGQNGANSGHVRIYQWNGSIWMQKGSDIDGEAVGDYSGCSVSMPDANTIAIGADGNAGNGIDAGHVRVFEWNGSTWLQKGNNIDGEAAGDISGWSVSMPDANTVGIGAKWNDGNGTKSGHVRVYHNIFSTEINQITFEQQISVSPNPSNGLIYVNVADQLDNATIVVRNTLGQEFDRKSNVSGISIELIIDGGTGVYFIEIMDEKQKALLKVIKE